MNGLIVLPGSYGSVTVVAATPPTARRRLASARIDPSCGSTTTTSPPLAPIRVTASASARSQISCRAPLMVSSTASPGRPPERSGWRFERAPQRVMHQDAAAGVTAEEAVQCCLEAIDPCSRRTHMPGDRGQSIRPHCDAFRHRRHVHAGMAARARAVPRQHVGRKIDPPPARIGREPDPVGIDACPCEGARQRRAIVDFARCDRQVQQRPADRERPPRGIQDRPGAGAGTTAVSCSRARVPPMPVPPTAPTYAARTTSATANAISARWMTPPGYGAARSPDATWGPCGRQDDDFAVRGDVHVQAGFRHGPESRATGGVPDLAFQRGLLRFELHPLAVQAAHPDPASRHSCGARSRRRRQARTPRDPRR